MLHILMVEFLTVMPREPFVEPTATCKKYGPVLLYCKLVNVKL